MPPANWRSAIRRTAAPSCRPQLRQCSPARATRRATVTCGSWERARPAGTTARRPPRSSPTRRPTRPAIRPTYGTFRVNVEPVSYAVHAGDTARFHVTAVDYDDKPVSTRVHVQLVFRHYENGSTQTTLGQATDVTTDASGHATGELAVGNPPYSSAELQATATAVQPGSRNPAGDSYLWIMGAGQAGWDNGAETTQIVADKKTYAPGDTAHLSIVSETGGFYALVIAQGFTVQKSEVMHRESLRNHQRYEEQTSDIQ